MKKNSIRPAKQRDIIRITEIEIFNYRLNFYPIFQNDAFYFDELQVPKQTEKYNHLIDAVRVYDDGVIKGFIHVENREVKKLFVEPVLQGNGIGSKLLDYAIKKMDAQFLWALEKNAGLFLFINGMDSRLPGQKNSKRVQRKRSFVWNGKFQFRKVIV